MLSETILKFGVELPEEVLPDNCFASLLFQSLDLFINHELVTSKSSDSDYPISNYVFLRDGFNESLLETTGICEGYFESRNRDQDDYLAGNGALSPGGKAYAALKRHDAVEVTREGVKYYKYQFAIPINHGLSRQDKPLPAGKRFLI